jgi:hypothetical protein
MLSIAIPAIPVVVLLVVGALWLWHEARMVARPEFAEYNARMDAADRLLDGLDAGPVQPVVLGAGRTRGDRGDALAA